MSLVRSFAARLGWLEDRRVRRFPAGELNATYVAGSTPKRVPVKDISCGGLYLFTRDRWMPGTNIDLTLRKRGLSDNQPADSVRLRAGRSASAGTESVWRLSPIMSAPIFGWACSSRPGTRSGKRIRFE